MSTSGKIRVKKSGVTNDKLVNNRGLTVPSVNFADSFMFSEFGNEDLLEYNHEEQTWYLDMKKMFPGIDRFKITDPVEGELLIYDKETDKFINDSTVINELKEIQKSITNFKSDILLLKNDDVEIAKKIADINTNITSITNRIAVNEESITQINSEITELKDQNQEINQQVTSITNDIGEINGTIINISTEITNIKDSVVDLGEIQNDISEINQKIQNDIEPHLDKIDDDIDELQRRINIPNTDLISQLNYFNNQISQLNNIIQIQQNLIAELSSTISSTPPGSTSLSGGLPNFRYDIIDKEIPVGLINGINKIFTLDKTPVLGSESIFLNGVLQDLNRDYTINGKTITFVEAPLVNMAIRCNYRISDNMTEPIGNPIIYNIEYGSTPAYFYSLIEREIPVTQPNGIITSFDLIDSPISGSESVFLNGVLQEPGPSDFANYTISGKTINFVEPPLPGMVIRCTYRKFIQNI